MRTSSRLRWTQSVFRESYLTILKVLNSPQVEIEQSDYDEVIVSNGEEDELASDSKLCGMSQNMEKLLRDTFNLRRASHWPDSRY